MLTVRVDIFERGDIMAKIKGVDIIVNSSDKMGRHMGVVKSGCGVHKSVKDYDRKKDKKNLKKTIDKYL